MVDINNRPSSKSCTFLRVDGGLQSPLSPPSTSKYFISTIAYLFFQYFIVVSFPQKKKHKAYMHDFFYVTWCYNHMMIMIHLYIYI